VNPDFDMSEPAIARQPRPAALIAVTICGVLAGGLVGGSTNAVNGAVSPNYFVTVLGWRGVENVWRASIAQGVFEGLLVGIVFSIIFAVGVGTITGACCSFGFALKHLARIVAGGYLFWTLGGLAAMGLATLSPEFYRATFFGVPQEFEPMLRYAWVGGSIWGVEFGGFLSLVVGLVLLRNDWHYQAAGGRVGAVGPISFGPDLR
jgi:hypothetical protein